MKDIALMKDMLGQIERLAAAEALRIDALDVTVTSQKNFGHAPLFVFYFVMELRLIQSIVIASCGPAFRPILLDESVGR
jgi:hypothetical protein